MTLLLLPSKGDEFSSKQILELLDAPASAPGWAWTAGKEPGVIGEKVDEVVAKKSEDVSLPCKSRYTIAS